MVQARRVSLSAAITSCAASRMPRGRDSDREIAIQIGPQREVDRHDEHGDEVHHQVQRIEETRHQRTEDLLRFFERDREDAVLTGDQHVLHTGDRREDALESCFPLRHHVGAGR